MRINCTETQAELPLFVGGDLESSVRDRVAAHLENCEPCRDVLLAASESRDILIAGLQQTADLHGAFVATSSTPSAWPGLRDQLRAEGLIQTPSAGLHSGSAGGTAPAPRGRLLHFVQSTAAAAVLLLFGAVAGQFWNGSGSAPLAPVEGGPLVHSPVSAPVPVLDGMSGTGPSALAKVIPAGDPGSSLKKLDCVEDSFTRDAIYLTGREIQPFSAFPSSAARAVSFRGAAIPAPLPAPTAAIDGVR